MATPVGYSDSDYAGDVNTRQSTSGFIFLLNEGPIAWSSRRQQCVSLSATEAENVKQPRKVHGCDAFYLKSFLTGDKHFICFATIFPQSNSPGAQVSTRGPNTSTYVSISSEPNKKQKKLLLNSWQILSPNHYRILVSQFYAK